MTLNALEWPLQIYISIISQLNHQSTNSKNIENVKYPEVSWNVIYSVCAGMWWTLKTPDSYIVSVTLHPLIYSQSAVLLNLVLQCRYLA